MAFQRYSKQSLILTRRIDYRRPWFVHLIQWMNSTLLLEKEEFVLLKKKLAPKNTGFVTDLTPEDKHRQQAIDDRKRKRNRIDINNCINQ